MNTLSNITSNILPIPPGPSVINNTCGVDPASVLGDPATAMRSAVKTWRRTLAMMPDIVREASYITPFSISPLLPCLLLSLARQKNSPDTKASYMEEYDYVIIGAGSAGSVVSGRLSEEKRITILLLEAGKSPPMLTDVPGISQIYAGSDIDWKYKTKRQKYAAYGINGGEIPYSKGKVIGGSSITNQMIYNRGHPSTYDTWAANGANGWNWDGVFPYFLKSENNTYPPFANNGYHSTRGPMTVSQVYVEPVLRDAFPQAARELGYEYIDASGPGRIGVVNLQGNLRDNQRCSTAKAYLVPAENRTNLHILKEAFVTKIIFDGKKASGVQFDFKGKHGHVVKARREVIVSCGAINTAKLLMLSGIGPREELEKWKIRVIADVPVGENFHDHPGTIMNFIANRSVPKFSLQVVNPLNTLKYIDHRDGPLAEITGFSSISFFTNDEKKGKMEIPDNEIYFIKATQGFYGRRFNLKPEVNAKLIVPYLANTMISCVAQALHPKSRGSVTLRSADPYDPPIIDPNFLSAPEDLESIVAGMKMCVKMSSTSAMQKFDMRLAKAMMPGCEDFADDTNKYYRCYARHFTITICHYVGTAKMGNTSDHTTVVDHELRVKGIEGLRVADGSVMPSLPTANPNNPIIMIGEKAADLIKKTINSS